MVPGEILHHDVPVEINAGAERIELDVVNTGDRPVQVGSHVHFPQANAALEFDREAAHGHRLDIPAGTAVRFEPGLGQRVSLVPLGGAREVHGISLNAPGQLDAFSESTERAILDGNL
ncbi:urease subunit beta [Nocardia sp. BMG51109]|uniref:urease subunit beta n=1 Tax=Nocardia sp. BMG51109 TaxID=1056816 RepID=UPI000466F41B|nr:urease subunit beta [Nocardia sp. BMG51109]